MTFEYIQTVEAIFNTTWCMRVKHTSLILKINDGDDYMEFSNLQIAN